MVGKLLLNLSSKIGHPMEEKLMASHGCSLVDVSAMVIVSCILLVEMLVMGSAIDVKNNVFFV
jgi:uncharacterized protein YggT (Ycf19 family)